MLDITKQNLYITRFQRAAECRLTRRFIPMDMPHNRDSFTFILSGKCKFTLDNGSVHMPEPGELMYLAAGQDYSLEVLSDDHTYLICDFIFNSNSPRVGNHYVLKNPAAMERLFRKLIAARAITTADRIPRCMAILYQIYGLLVQNELEQYVPGSAKMRIEQARVHIQSHIEDPKLSVADLAQQAGMSEVHFRKLFADLYTISPAKYITQERVSYACTLMALRELRLEDIAVQSGFSSLPYFSKVFKAVTGITPAAYRKTLHD